MGKPTPSTYWIMLESIAAVVLQHVQGSIIEIGVGMSTSIFEKYARLHSVNFYTCDSNMEWKSPVVYQKYLHFAMTSLEFIKDYKELIQNDPPSVVLLDGSHDSRIVLKEARFFFRHLVVGGVIFIHDTLPSTEADTAPSVCGNNYLVRQVIEEWNDVADCITWPYTARRCGLTVVLKKGIDRPYYRR